MKKLITTVLCGYFCIGIFAQTQIACNLYENNCKIGVGTPYPGERLHLVDGHFLIEGGGEIAIIMKRDITYSSIHSGESKNPMFYSGRLTQAGDGDPEYRFLYKDDKITGDAIPVFEFDRKGIVASVKPEPPSAQSRGSHFEGFYKGAANPYFRLNSNPRMRLEMGAGGNSNVDVAIERYKERTIGFYNGDSCHIIIDSNGRLGIDAKVPSEKIEIADGNLLISNSGNGVILTSQNGKRWIVKVDNDGGLSTLGYQTYGAKEVKIDKTINVFPNPSDNLINVAIPEGGYSKVDLEIYNLDGEMIFMKQFYSNLFDVDIKDFSSGIYILNIKDQYGNLIQTKKIIKK